MEAGCGVYRGMLLVIHLQLSTALHQMEHSTAFKWHSYFPGFSDLEHYHRLACSVVVGMANAPSGESIVSGCLPPTRVQNKYVESIVMFHFGCQFDGTLCSDVLDIA